MDFNLAADSSLALGFIFLLAGQSSRRAMVVIFVKFMKLTRKQKAWEQKHKPVKQPVKRRRPKDYKFDMDSGNIVWRAHGGSGKPIEEV